MRPTSVTISLTFGHSIRLILRYVEVYRYTERSNIPMYEYESVGLNWNLTFNINLKSVMPFENQKC